MQFILTEQEHNDLLTQIHEAECENTNLIQKLCTEVCNHKIIEFWGSRKEPWECILNEESNGHGYCDECPVQDDCPYPNKCWSK